MMRILQKLLGALLATIFYTVSAQNWSPIPTSYTCNYSNQNPNVPAASIWIDSSKIQSGLNWHFMNRIIALCDTCHSSHLAHNFYDTTYLLSDQSNFLQTQIAEIQTGKWWLKIPGNIVIHTNAPISQPWLLDSLNLITAQVISRSSKSILTAIDSIQTLLLSSGDTIVLSKNFGVLQYPIGYSASSYFRLIGIEGLNLGKQSLKFKDFFNFSPGDVFQFSRQDNNFIFFPPFYQQGLVKYTVLSRLQNTDTIRYRVQAISMDSSWLGGYQPTFTVASRIDTLVFIDSATHFTNLYANQKTPLNVAHSGNITTPCINQIETGWDTHNLGVKSYGIICPNSTASGNQYGVASSVDTINPNLYLERNSVLILGREAKAGLGITSNLSNDYNEVKMTCLTAYIKGPDTVGLILPNSQFVTSAAYMSQASIPSKLYPNPFSFETNLFFARPFAGTVEVFDATGLVIMKEQLIGMQTFNIQTHTWAEGIYFLQITSPQGRETKKMIKE